MVLLFIVLYLIISAVVVGLSMRWARRHKRRGWVWGSVAALVMYHLVFWDLMPTLVMHRNYCSTEAGFWIYKTPEEWIGKNPGVLEMLVMPKKLQSSHEGNMDNYINTYVTNERFRWVVKRSGPYFANVWRHEQTFVDVQDDAVLARYVDYSRGVPNPLELGSRHGMQGMKFWLSKGHCEGGLVNQSLMRGYKNKLHGVTIK
jgi:hypothetical protein